jgi:hypothetical protein
MPAEEAADQHLRRIDKIIEKFGHVPGPERARQVCLLQSTPQSRLIGIETGDREEAILYLASQKGTIPQIFLRLPLRIQYDFQLFDDCLAVGQEELQQFDMRLEHETMVPEPDLSGQGGVGRT